MVFQDTAASQILDLLPGSGRPVTAGIGVPRSGLVGAADSITDAEYAMAMAERHGGTIDFGSQWLEATLLPHLKRLQPLLDPSRAPAQPYLRDAVRAYAKNGFSTTAAARTLHIHANTVKYRIGRWRQLTGWDPRTLDGLLRSSLSITFSTEANREWEHYPPS
jgi:sugar diacid utilization regulator